MPNIVQEKDYREAVDAWQAFQMELVGYNGKHKCRHFYQNNRAWVKEHVQARCFFFSSFYFEWLKSLKTLQTKITAGIGPLLWYRMFSNKVYKYTVFIQGGWKTWSCFE